MEVVIVLSVSVLSEIIVTPPPVGGGERSIVISVSVCLSASISPELHVQPSPIFCTYVVRSSSGGVAIRYVLPFLWMTQFYNQKYV